MYLRLVVPVGAPKVASFSSSSDVAVAIGERRTDTSAWFTS